MVLKGVSLCCYTACCLDSSCPITFVQWCSTAVLVAFCLYLGCLEDILLGSMVNSPLLHSMGISPLSMGISLGCWGSLGLSVCQLLGSVFLGLDLSSHASLAHHESFSLSMAGFLSETKLKASFSAMSQFAALALTQSSKVLGEIIILFVYSMVLKEVALLTSYSISWKETFFLPDLPMVLKEVSLLTYGLEKKSLYLWSLTVSLTLLVLSFSLVTLMPSTPRVLKGVDLYCSFLPYVLAGVLKGVSVHVHIAMVLKELDGWSWKDLDATLWFLCDIFPSISKQGSWKESLELVFVLFSTIDLETFLHNTWMRPSLELAACPTMISLHVLVSTT